MSSTSGLGPSATSAFPAAYRIPLLYIEPLFAFNGALLCLFNPATYTKAMTRNKLWAVQPQTNWVYTELAGGWLFFAFTEAVVLRNLDSVRAWRIICLGMLLSDAAYCHSCAQAVGGWQVWLQLGQWTIEDLVVTVTTWPFVIIRILIALGIGAKEIREGEAEVESLAKKAGAEVKSGIKHLDGLL